MCIVHAYTYHIGTSTRHECQGCASYCCEEFCRFHRESVFVDYNINNVIQKEFKADFPDH